MGWKDECDKCGRKVELDRTDFVYKLLQARSTRMEENDVIFTLCRTCFWNLVSGTTGMEGLIDAEMGGEGEQVRDTATD